MNVEISEKTLEYACTLSHDVWTQTHAADCAVHAHTLSLINTHTYTHTPTNKQLVFNFAASNVF